MRVRLPKKALLFASTLFSNEDYYAEALQSLQRIFGEAAMESPPTIWNYTDYYKKEIGEPIYRRFIFFKKLIGEDSLSIIKLTTNEVEKNLSTAGKRNINIDPGYLTPAKIVLASTKDYSHRIYLKDGIYGDVALIFKNGQFIPHINTYRDYQDEKFINVFTMARKLLFLIKESSK